MTVHACNGEPIEDDDGFYVAKCTCGWSQNGLPDMETAIDWLMQHAQETK